jgi:transposase InsO family protein
VDPAPKRGKTMPWKTSLKAHFGVIAATDFFTVEVLTLGGLVRYVVWFVIDLESRRVHIAALIRHPHDAWIQQVARNLTDSVDGFLRGKRYLIHDRDPLFTDAFRAVLSAVGIECLKLPARSPNLNAVAERFVLSIKSEYLDKLVPLGERHSASRSRSSSSTTISSATTKASTAGCSPRSRRRPTERRSLMVPSGRATKDPMMTPAWTRPSLKSHVRRAAPILAGWRVASASCPGRCVGKRPATALLVPIVTPGRITVPAASIAVIALPAPTYARCKRVQTPRLTARPHRSVA